MDCFHDFCLACDRQCVDSPYCSQSCRLADLEKASKSTPPSPRSHTTTAWSSSMLDRMAAEALEVAANNKTIPSPPLTRTPRQKPRLTPSSSRSSLTSTSSSSSNALTEQARLELQEYFSSFDQTRAAKRRSSILR